MTPERAAIDRQLEAIFASEDFSAAPKMRALLRYLVEATLAGDPDRLKGYAIGVDVFERGSGFDPGTDPIVRVQAGRLRKLLETYYLTAGQGDPIRIEIPKGNYAVEFLPGPTAEATEARAASEGPGKVAPISETHRSWSRATLAPWALWVALPALVLLTLLVARSFEDDAPPGLAASPPHTAAAAITLAVLPFTNMSKDASNVHFADGLTDGLTTALARIKPIALASRTSAFQYREAKDLRHVGRELGVRYVVEGGLQHDGERMRVNVQLIDAATGAHLWAQHYDRAAGDDFAVQSELVTTLAAEIRPQLYAAAKRAMQGRPLESATAWQLYMQATWMPGEARNSLAWEKERVALATRALKIDPNFGQAHSVLADKLAYLATIDPQSDTEEARAEAAAHARRALELASDDPDAVFNVSIHYWHAGENDKSVEGARRTLELDPNHVLARFLVKVAPFSCAEAPQEAIDELVAFDAAISPDNPVRWVTLAWISSLYLNNGDFRRAEDAARRSDQIFRTPNTFYRFAAILAQLGETRTAVEQIDQQRENWPNIDLRHYADATIRRQCREAPKSEYLHRIYSDLADALDAAHRGG